jgi:hypothetical protein
LRVQSWEATPLRLEFRVGGHNLPAVPLSYFSGKNQHVQGGKRAYTKFHMKGSHTFKPGETRVHVFGLKANPKLELPRMNLSGPLELPAGELRLAFTTKPVGKGEVPPKGAPMAVIPASWSQAVLIFFTDPANKILPVNVKVVDASARVFGPGDRYWLNLSAAVVAPRVGDPDVPRIDPGKSHIMKGPRGGARDLPVIVKCLLPEDGQVRDLCRTTWRHDPARRKLVFILPNPPRRVPRVWSVPFSDPVESDG